VLTIERVAGWVRAKLLSIVKACGYGDLTTYLYRLA